ncbi:Methyltransferase small domain [Trinorchestia longiramus]|nr:Methyltransferase small domain [Trinorchestia longiramus]
MNFGEIADKTVADLGCGCGVLAIGAAMLGASAVTGFDIDEDALAVCRDNLEELDLNDSVHLVRIDVNELLKEDCRWKDSFDTVILNPPFGTKNNQGADLKFLQAAGELSKGAVYSLHKTATRKHLLRKATALGLTGEVLAELRYDLPKTYNFHKKDSVDVHVDFIRFVKKSC